MYLAISESVHGAGISDVLLEWNRSHNDFEIKGENYHYIVNNGTILAIHIATQETSFNCAC